MERNGGAYALSANRAKPDALELSIVFGDHISPEALVLCDGLASYNALPAVAGCTVENCMHFDEGQKSFFNLNTVNNFHSMIKRIYKNYCGVATAYLNRYNALFSSLFRNKGTLAARLEEAVPSPISGRLWHGRESGDDGWHLGGLKSPAHLLTNTFCLKRRS